MSLVTSSDEYKKCVIKPVLLKIKIISKLCLPKIVEIISAAFIKESDFKKSENKLLEKCMKINYENQYVNQFPQS